MGSPRVDDRDKRLAAGVRSLSAPRILALVPDAFGGRGGIAQYNRDLLGALATEAEITVLPRHAPDGFAPPPNIVQRGASSGRLTYAIKALALAFAQRPDTVFCGHLFMAPLAALVASLIQARLVLQIHGIDAWERPGSLTRMAAERADLVLSVSRYTRRRFLSWAALPPERVAVLPNTVGEAFAPGDRAAARAPLCLGDATVLLSVGRLDAREQYKGHDRVIRAQAEMLARGWNLVYLIAGEGADRARLEGLAIAEGGGPTVRFLGPVLPDDLPDLYRAADMFVMPSTGEGFGIVFIEAMACGTPALGLGVGGASDALADGLLGTTAKKETFAADLEEALAAPKLSPEALSKAVNARYGRTLFASHARALFRKQSS